MSSEMDKRDFLRLLSSAAVAAPTAVIASSTMQTINVTSEKHSVYNQVTKARTIRCGYDIWPPIIDRNPNTGQLSGIFYDYMEAIGQNLGLKIEWVDGISYASYITDLKFDRIDAMCAGVWPIGEVIGAVDFTPPLYYVPINAYVRADDFRFDHDLTILNDAHFTIADIDGLVPARIARQTYPKAKTMSLPQTSPASDMLVSVVTRKADITFTDAMTAEDFMKYNPGALRQVPTPQPIRIFGNTVAVDKGNDDFLRMLSYATEELQNSGVVENILNKYETYPGSFRRVTRPYN
jgi:polar amino acid transport system substrate-binding protein